MTDPDRITDDEFLDQFRERLKSSGHTFVFVDRGLILFSKVAAVIFGLFLVVSVTFFGQDLKQAHDEVAKARSDIADTRRELAEDRRRFNKYAADLDAMSVELERKAKELDDQLADAGRGLTTVQNTFGQSMSFWSDFVAKTATALKEEDREEELNDLRDFYREVIDLADRNELDVLRVGLLQELAELEWFEGKHRLSRSLFDEAVQVALDQGQQRIAAEMLMTQARFERSIFHKDRQLAVAKATRLFKRALRLFKANDEIAGQADALRSIAEAHRLEGDNSEALEYFGKARQLYLTLNTSQPNELLALSSIAEIHRDLGNTGEAIDYYSESVSIAEALQDYHLAFEFALELARLQEKHQARLGYLCTASQYIDQARPPMNNKIVQRKLERIDSTFDAGSACGERQG